LKKIVRDILLENKKLVETHDIRWKDFGSRFRGKMKRDGSKFESIMQNIEGSSSSLPKVDDEELVDITNFSEIKRVIRKIEELVKWS